MISRLGDLLRTFIGTDNQRELARKTGMVALGAVLYRQLDWLLVALTASLVAVLKYHGASHLSIFIVLWSGNLILSWTVVFCSHRLDVDFTLSNGWRRLVNKSAEHSRLLASVLEAGFAVGIALWAGAGPLHIFLRERIQSPATLWAVFILASGMQMALWTGLFVLGYESVSSLAASWLPS